MVQREFNSDGKLVQRRFAARNAPGRLRIEARVAGRAGSACRKHPSPGISAGLKLPARPQGHAPTCPGHRDRSYLRPRRRIVSAYVVVHLAQSRSAEPAQGGSAILARRDVKRLLSEHGAKVIDAPAPKSAEGHHAAACATIAVPDMAR